MCILVLLCNPRPASLNRALAERSLAVLEEGGHEVLFHDLYAEGFDPVLTAEELARGFSLDPLVQEHYRALGAADGLVIFHPDWWGGPPAALKGWADRVLRQGIAYDLEGEDFTEKSFAPLLGGKRALVFCTTDESDSRAARQLEELWRERVLGPCGMAVRCKVFAGLRSFGPAERAACFTAVDALVKEAFPACRRDP